MRKLDYSSPDMFINRISIDGSDYLEIFVDTPIGSVSRTPKMIRLKDEFSQLELSFEGFESLSKNTDGQEVISGDIYIIAKYKLREQKHLLASPILTVSKKRQGYKRKKISNTASFLQLTKEIKTDWQSSFSEALDNVSNTTPLYSPTKPPEGTKLKKRNRSSDFWDFSGFYGGFVKLISVFLIISGIGYLCLSIYGKALQVETTRNTALSLDPEALAKNQKDVVDETFKEIGIDRNKLTSDLSCFVEE